MVYFGDITPLPDNREFSHDLPLYLLFSLRDLAGREPVYPVLALQTIHLLSGLISNESFVHEEASIWTSWNKNMNFSDESNLVLF